MSNEVELAALRIQVENLQVALRRAEERLEDAHERLKCMEE